MEKKPAGAKSITNKVGLVLPVSRIEHYIRNATTRDRVSYATATALSAVVGYVLQELIELSLEAMCRSGRARLTTTHMLHALNSDPELAGVIPMSSIGTGTVPHPQPDDELDEDGEPIKKKKKTYKRCRKSHSRRRSTRKSHSRRRSTRKSHSRRRKTSASAVKARAIHTLIRSISRSRGRSPSAKRARTVAAKRLISLSRSRSRSKSYSRNKSLATKQRLMDRVIDVISKSRSRSRSRTPEGRRVQAEGFRRLINLSRSMTRSRSRARSQSRRRGGRPARKTQYKGKRVGKRLTRGTGTSY